MVGHVRITKTHQTIKKRRENDNKMTNEQREMKNQLEYGKKMKTKFEQRFLTYNPTLKYISQMVTI
jgi:hypothetical protein